MEIGTKDKFLGQKIKVIVVICFFLCVFLVSCNSIQQPQDVFSPPDYTQDDILGAEIERIKEIQKTDTVQALWRVIMMQKNGAKDTKDIQDACLQAILKDYTIAIEKKDYVTLQKILFSLDICGIKDGRFNLSQVELDAMIKDAVPASDFQNVGTKTDGKVSTLINGTVTIFVDKGIKVEKGMGRTDGVIGSGFFIDRQGTIVTNHHVISDMVNPKYEGFSRLYIRTALDPDTKIPAKVIGYDEILDIALLKAQIDSPFVFTLGSSAALDVGDKVYAIGSPIGLEKTLTSGIISARRNLFTMGQVLQIDAAVNSGNSGGPLIDQQGLVQGIVFAGMLQYAGLNFVIPVEYLKNELVFLANGGKRKHSWTGCYGKTQKSQTKDIGLQVLYVMPGSSANRAGLKAGDVITALKAGTQKQQIKNLEDMQSAVMKLGASTIVELEYTRQEDKQTTKNTALVFLQERPNNPGYLIYQSDLLANSFEPIFGFKLMNVSSTSSRKYSIKSLIKGSIADESGFCENDPVEVTRVQFNNEKTLIYAEFYTKRRKSGYLDLSMGLTAPLDATWYF